MKRLVLSVLLPWVAVLAHGQPSSPADDPPRSLAECVNEFTVGRVESTSAGYQYWFVGKEYLDGRTIKMSVVRPYEATHDPHAHGEDGFFFVLEGTAELILEDERRTVGPLTSFYCPPARLHGIRNVGDTDLKYLVIKKYPLPGQTVR